MTNDDGVDSPGIVALARVLDAAGHDVFVVAPACDLSGAAAAIGPLHRNEPIPFAHHEWPELPGVPVSAIDRPPATAVFAACLGGFGPPPEVVVSGINPGANTGHLVLHSGTVGAALTARNLGVPALAVSVKWSDHAYHWETPARLALAALGWVTEPDDPPRVLNLNVPNLPFEELRGIRDARLAAYGEVWVASADVSSGDLRMDFRGVEHQPDPESDSALLLRGFATVTPLAGVEAAPLKGAAARVENDG